MHPIKAAGYEGFTFLKKKDEQPEVINPKTGKPFDLTDPEFPVVSDKEHHFKWSYWKMPKSSDSIMLDYLEDHWAYFNRTRFGGRLTKPRIRLLRDVNAVRMKLRGLWTGSRTQPPGELAISPNLFNAPHEGWVNRVLIHEMCHQDEWETFGSIDRDEKGHGPRWQECMRKAGLHPNRFDTESNETYADQKEKVVFQQINEKKKPFLDALEVLKATRLHVSRTPKPEEKFLFATNDGVVLGEAKFPAPGKRGFWEFNVVKPPAGKFPVWLVSVKGLYEPTYKDLQAGRYEA